MLLSLLFEAKIDISLEARKNMSFINDGATRAVYEYEDGKVLKIAKNYEGYEANFNEIQQFECLTEKFAAKVLDYDQENNDKPKWIIMEKVTTDKEQLQKALFDKDYVFKTVTDSASKTERGQRTTPVFLTFRIFADALVKSKTKKYPSDWYWEEIDKVLLSKNSWLKELISKIKGCKVEPIDLHINNWGIRESTGELVLLDYGF